MIPICKESKKLTFIKDKNFYAACKFCHWLSSFKENYIGESKRSVATTNSTHDFESAKHLNKSIRHSCNKTILANVSTYKE